MTDDQKSKRAGQIKANKPKGIKEKMNGPICKPNPNGIVPPHSAKRTRHSGYFFCHSGQNVDFAVQWSIRPRRVELLKFLLSLFIAMFGTISASAVEMRVLR